MKRTAFRKWTDRHRGQQAILACLLPACALLSLCVGVPSFTGCASSRAASSPPSATLGASSLTFAPTSVGATSTAVTVTLTNTGGQPLQLAGLALSDTADYAYTTTCGTTLAAGTNCTMSVLFQPQTAGALSATLTLTDNSGGASGSQQVVQLSGNGSAALVPQAALTPAALQFPSTMQGKVSAAQTVTLSNSGNATLTIGSISLSDPKDYGYSSNCASSLSAGSSCAISVVFLPQTTGALPGTLVISDNSGTASGSTTTQSQQSVTLAGMGTALLQPKAVVSPTALTFSQTVTNASAPPQTATLTNTGTSALTITGVSLGGAAAQAFVLSAGNCIGSLPPGNSCTENVTYTPKLASTSDSATLTFTDDALGQPGTTQTVTMTGSAIAEVDSVTNFGDSITCGFYAQPQDGTGLVYSLEGYAGLFDKSLGVPAQNWCRQGDTAADLSRQWVPLHSTPAVNGHQLYTLMIGVNDAYRYGVPQTALSSYAQEVGGALAWLAMPNSDKVLPVAATQQSGAWTADVGTGLMSSDAGATLSFSVNQAVAGRNLYVVYHVWDLPYGQAGKAEIAVDGVVQATVDESTNASAYLPTENGTTDTFLLQTVALGAVGSHTVTFHSAGPAGSAVGLLWAGVPQQDYRQVDGAPRVLVGLITNSPSGNQSYVADVYNLQLKSLVPMLTTDGLNLTLVPSDGVLDSGTDFADILHPNTAGHVKLANTFEQYR